MTAFARYFLAPGLLVWSLSTGTGAFAEEVNPPTMCLGAEWNKLAPEAEDYVKKGDYLTSAAHNPRVKDYYLASDMYAKAATLFEQGSTQYINAIKTCPDISADDAIQQKALEAKAKKYIFKSYQTNHVGANRESRGLL